MWPLAWSMALVFELDVHDGALAPIWAAVAPVIPEVSAVPDTLETQAPGAVPAVHTPAHRAPVAST